MGRKKTCPDTIEKVCEYCNKTYNCSWNARKKQRYCNKVCANADPRTKEKIIKSQTETYIENYGMHPMKTEETRNNLKKSMLEKHGVDWGSKMEGYREKVRKTQLERYGDENYSNVEKREKTNIERFGTKCPLSNPEIIKKSMDTSKVNHFNRELLPLLNLKKLIPLFSESDYTTMRWTNKYKFKCQTCDHIFEHSVYNKKFLFCPKCSPTGKSKPEAELLEFLSSILPDTPVNLKNRSILNGKEIDLFVPSKNFGIEHDGLYWHSDLNSKSNRNDKYSHLKKLKACAFHGINLIRIFEDEWAFRKESVRFIIKQHLSLLNDSLPETFTIKPVDKQDYDVFLFENSLNMSNRITSIRYGIYLNDDLISTIGFKKNRKIEGEYELIDYCQSNKTSYGISAFSVLFDHFKKEHNPNLVRKYIDRRIEPWNFYLKCGFSVGGFGEPRWYLLESDYKSRIYDPTKYIGDKVWDCGTIKLMWKSSV